MVAILEKSEHNVDFHPIVYFVEASPLRYALTFKPTVYVSHIRQFWSTASIETTEEGTKILATVDGILIAITESSLRRNLKLNDEEGISTPTEPHHTPSPEAQQTSHTTHLSPTLPPVTTAPISTFTPSDTPPLRQYTRRTRIAQSLVLPPIADEPVSPFGDGSQEMVAKFEAQELDINSRKARIQVLEDKDRRVAEQSEDDAPIKGRRLDVGEEASKRFIPTGSGSIPTAGPPATEVPTGSDVVPTAYNTPWKKISIQGTDVAGFDKSKVECFNCHKMGHFARKCRAPRSQDRGMRDNYRQGSKVEEQAPKALMAIDRVGWD
nr:ribonuclease H-like domain, reverse transcriptase, RNA-dependent DNA polymerase [Tanacetum cinerariifolium]